jgi:glycerophosphoryl diester phosphodiesterase
MFAMFSDHFLFLLITQSIIISFGILVLVPLFTLGYEIALLSSGLSYLSLSNLVQFLLNPFSMLFCIIVIIVLSIFIVFEDYFLKEFFYMRYHGIPLKRTSLILSSVKLTFQVFVSLKFRYLISIWILILSFNLPFLIFITRFNQFIRYIASASSPSLLWFFVLGIYAFSILFVNRKNLILLKKHLIWNLTQGLMFIILYIIVLLLSISLISILIPQMYAIAAFISVLNRINQGFALFVLIISTFMHYALYMILSESTLILDETEILDQPVIKTRSLFKSPMRKLLAFSLFIFLLGDIYLYLGIIRNGSMLQTLAFDQITITSHRGYSFNYPENTIVAIERAIEVYTDYVEVDVRVTLDNEFVLLHDDNLMRTTGVNMSISKVPLKIVQTLDAGKWLSPRFEGTNIPTLREALEVTKGKAGINLDLKFNDNHLFLMPDLVALIDEYEMQYQVLITSTCLQCLVMAKELNPNIQTGYITYRVTPALLNNSAIDVISMKSSFVTQSIIRQVHDANKRILVWTVNSRSEIERMSRLGVNNIITDRPFYAKQVIFELTADRFIVTLVKVILNS